MSVYDLIAQERERAVELRDSGRFRYVASDPDCPDFLRFTALAEELGEVARALHENSSEDLLPELIQLAGVATSWAEYLLTR
jgi:hypothetical protein